MTNIIKIGNHYVIRGMSINDYIYTITGSSNKAINSYKKLCAFLNDLCESQDGCDPLWNFPLDEMKDGTVMDWDYFYVELFDGMEPRYFETNISTQPYKHLPQMCYGVLATDNSIIRIQKGESGYYPTTYEPSLSTEEILKMLNEVLNTNNFVSKDEIQKIINTIPRKAAEATCDKLNEAMGIPKNVRKAMEAGSMFGWHTPGTNPEDEINLMYLKEEVK